VGGSEYTRGLYRPLILPSLASLACSQYTYHYVYMYIC
jgi:hypothetical protein